MSSTSMNATLYPDWVLRLVSVRTQTCPNCTGRWEGTGGRLTLEEELDASSVYDPLQSSQGAEEPGTPPHYSEVPTNIPPFDIAKVGMLPRMSPITDQENALLNIAPGSPVRRAAPPGLDQGQGWSGPSSCSDSPMSLGSPAPRSSLGLALKVRTRPVTPSISAYGKGCPGVPWRKMRKRWTPRGATTPIRPKTKLIVTSTQPERLVRLTVEWNLITNPTG